MIKFNGDGQRAGNPTFSGMATGATPILRRGTPDSKPTDRNGGSTGPGTDAKICLWNDKFADCDQGGFRGFYST
jgi:hypothetical protein